MIMGYGEILKSRRKMAGLTQKQASEKLECAIGTVSSAERPYVKTGQLPGEIYLRKFADIFGISPRDKAELERALLTERALHTLPPIVADGIRECLTSKSAVNSSGRMPLAFRKMLAADWQERHERRIGKKFSRDIIKSIINGTRLLSRDDVIELAKGFKKDPELYLLEAKYMTDGIFTIAGRRDGGWEFLKDLLAMPKKDFDILMNTLIFAIAQYKAIYHNKMVLDEEPKSNHPSQKKV